MSAPGRGNQTGLRVSIMLLIIGLMVLSLVALGFAFYLIVQGLFWLYYVQYVIRRKPLPDLNKFRIR